MDVLVFVEALFLLAVALLASSFVISSIWETERRAALIGGVVLLVLVGVGIGLFALRAVGFFQRTPGLLILVAGLVISLTALLFFVRTDFPSINKEYGPPGCRCACGMVVIIL